MLENEHQRGVPVIVVFRKSQLLVFEHLSEGLQVSGLDIVLQVLDRVPTALLKAAFVVVELGYDIDVVVIRLLFDF